MPPLPSLPLPPPVVARSALAARRALRRLADALVPAPVAVFDDAVGLGVTMTLAVAVRLRLADRLAGGPRSVDELAAACAVDPEALGRLLRALVAGGYFRRLPDGRYANNRRAQPLRHGVGGSIAHFVEHMGSAANVAAWSDFGATVRTGRNAFQRVHGQDVWAWLAAHPADGARFADAMVDLTRLDAPAIAAAYPWSSCGLLCDVAGGRGALLAEILARHRALRAVLFDAPDVVASARPLLAERGVAERVTLCAGNFFEHVPAGADTYVLKEILHDWDDERALAILRNCRAAMGDGRLLVIEILVEPDSTAPPGPWVDLHMMTVCQEGRQRSRADFERLFAAAGLHLARIVPTAAPASIVEAQPV
jgi:hypothetical protein